jgi:hypothetical protein
VLKAVAREQPMKIKRAGKGLAGAVMICKLWRLAITL